MAEITFSCAACRETLAVDESLVGQDVACPACGQAMTVPRVRAPLTVKGRSDVKGGTRPAQPPAAPENLSGLSAIDAFGGERGQLVLRRRRWLLAGQILATIGMLATLVAVVSGAYRFFDAREARKRAVAEAALRQEEQQERRRRQQTEARQLNQATRRKQATWSLDDDACERLWRALNTCHPRREAQARFDFWVDCDAETFGLFSEAFGRIRASGDIETACQRLAGFALGLQGEPARLPPLAEFRTLARLALAEPE